MTQGDGSDDELVIEREYDPDEAAIAALLREGEDVARET